MTRNFVGCILSTARLSGIQDGEGSVVVVIVHQTDESLRLSHGPDGGFPSSRMFPCSDDLAFIPFVFRRTRVNLDVVVPGRAYTSLMDR